MISRLEAVGQWLSQFGHTIFKTRGGPTGPQSWGTRKQTADTIYLHILDTSSADTDRWITLTGTESLPADQVQSVVNGEAVPSRRDMQGRLQAKVDKDDAVLDLVLEVTKLANQ
jgi:alpha-L-fucosidase